MIKTEIRVTRDDIRKGTPEDGKSCAIALACKRHGLTPVNGVTGDEFQVQFGGATFRLHGKGMERFINGFDKSKFNDNDETVWLKAVKPKTFKVTISPVTD